MVVGGGLQGLELCYLALKAGWRVDLLDKKISPPAMGVCRKLAQTDLEIVPKETIGQILGPYDLILPALENPRALDILTQARAEGLIPPLAFDPEAYRVSSSKRESKKLFASLGIPVARDFDQGISGPFVAKPDGGSGSRGVRVLRDRASVLEAFPREEDREGWVIEECLPGPSYSIEVTARKGQAQAWQVTRLIMDDRFDCRMVLSDHGLSRPKAESLSKMAVGLAKALELTGIMDLEVIDYKGKFRALEIDARFPSQTPTVVYHSTGANLARAHAACFIDLEGPAEKMGPPRKVCLKHVFSVSRNELHLGEGIMASMGPVVIEPGFGPNSRDPEHKMIGDVGKAPIEALLAGNPNGPFWAGTFIYRK
jgi:pyrrolysine biosynthesis protein PylC